MSDPWEIKNNSKTNRKTDSNESVNGVDGKPLSFEDNFVQASNLVNNCLDTEIDVTNGIGNNIQQHQPLPDSASYLLRLENKLQKLKNGSKLVDALVEKREDCLRSLLEGDKTVQSNVNIENNNVLFELETPIDSAPQFYRHIQPVQPITIGETVEIVKYDQLEEQRISSEDISDESEAEKN